MNILAIETSCDETAAAIISGDPFSAIAQDNNTQNATAQNTSIQAAPQLLSNVVVSQIDIFKAYGGVIPEVAARSHLEAILPVIHQAFKDAGFTKSATNTNLAKNNQNTNSTRDTDDWSRIDAIAVTHTPGLLGSLLIGTLTARTLAILHNKPLYAVHHLKSHIYANWLPAATPLDPSIITTPFITATPSAAPNTSAANTTQTPQFPLLALVISGGHTQIIRMENHNQFEIIGTTLDDAVGECFDKVAKILGLPYPGGPAISKAAQTGDPKKYPLPHPQIKNYDFSFSGLKTAVLRAVQKAVNVPISYPSHELAKLLTPQQVADFAASFEETACDILLEKLQKAERDHPDTKSIVIAGGVSANQRLRTKTLGRKAADVSSKSACDNGSNRRVCPVTTGANSPEDEKKASAALPFPVFFPEPRFSGDNAAMVGAAAFYEIASGKQPTDPLKLNILPRSVIN